MKACVLLIVMLTSLTQCKQGGSSNSNLNERLFHRGESIASIEDKQLKEVSGMVASSVNNGKFWVHNDSGNNPEIYLINKNGEKLMTVVLGSVKNSDWEDITLVNDDTDTYLFIADIGDNLGRRKKLYIHKIEEPEYTGDSVMNLEPRAIETMTFTYANGARDSETLLSDPNLKTLVLVTKREKKCFVYNFEFETTQKPVELEPDGTTELTELTGGDVNASGEILLKSYDNIYYWGPSSGSVAQRIMNGPDFRIPYEIEPQGEAICWEGENSFYTVSEFHPFARQDLYRYQKAD